MLTDQKKCSLCKIVIPNCQTCISKANCTQCNQGYYPKADSSACLNCREAIPSCLSCLSGDRCISCEQGYGVDGGWKCSSCSVMMEGCLLCEGLGRCSACMQEYELLPDGSCKPTGQTSVIVIALGVAGGAVLLVVMGTHGIM